jgi:C-terminal binding-module, SLH-like, of glucodextranase
VPRVLQADAAVPGVLAWRMQHGRDAALVVLNTADAPTLLSRLPTGAAPGSRLAGLFSLDGTAVDTQVDAYGALTAVLPPRSGQVWRLPPVQPALAAAVPGAATRVAAADRRPTITALQLADDGDSALASGRAAPDADLQLVLDGQLAGATATRADRQGRWQARVDTRALVDGRTPHRLVAWLPAERLASAPRRLVARRQWQLLVDQADPAGDDHGPDGRTTYPTDPTWGANRQMDLRRLRMWRAGGALRIALDMHRVTQSWAPQNGFDHVAFTLFFGLPGRDDGQSMMPLQDAALPEGMRWHYRLRAHGWSNAWFAAAGASADSEGLASAPGAQVEVDAARHTVLFTLPAGALGDAAALRGLKVYVTTWDWDGGYRALQPQAGGHAMGGGPGPKVMDAIGPVTLP